MKELQERFDEMADCLVRVVEFFKATHERGVDFGTGDQLFPAEIHTLQAVEEGRGSTVTALAEYFDVSKATISERVTKLAGKGLLSKTKIAGSKEIVLKLTEKGKIAYQGHEEHHVRLFEAFARQFGDDFEQEVVTMTDSFRKYHSAAVAVEREELDQAKHGPK